MILQPTLHPWSISNQQVTLGDDFSTTTSVTIPQTTILSEFEYALSEVDSEVGIRSLGIEYE